MTLTFDRESIPLKKDGPGTVRASGTRVTIDTIVGFFNQGAGADEIVSGFPVISLADVYLILGYYLRHHPAVEAYLTEQQREAAAIRQRIEGRWPQDGLRERLLAKRQTAKSP
ncbi:MAG: DUF433 domain-containing protein [Dehalococcoidia bacterium]